MSSPIRSIVYTALFSALFIVMSAIKLPLGFSPVPITLQNLALMLAGAFLGARYGFLSILFVCILTALGLPLLGGEGGLAVVFGATGGFIWMFPLCALTVGYFSRKVLSSSALGRNKKLRLLALFAVFMIFGSLLSYVGGVPWLAYAANLSIAKSLTVGMYPFLPGDLIKAAVAAIVTSALYAYMPGLHRAKPAASGSQA
ncbi:biotin transporter BioY [Paenibacillus sp. GCM10012307]|uniref:Biotin transporter n=1 Tax=Paenibacillus roseus TaxID=2798579 RepID=A0A934MN47_9BACL|nr:ECF transporter S component [Paenibacillus roseus]MBJ6364075.1 biotin transporter BioY [Paenibacillus roseus]